MKHAFWLTLSLLLSISAFSQKERNNQISYEKRIELELKDGYTNERIYEFGKQGFVMTSRNIEVAANKVEWKYELYNTDLESVKSKSIHINKKFRFDERFVDEHHIHTLYKDKKGNYAIVSVDAATLEIKKVEGTIPKKSWISGMAILGDYAFLKASIKKDSFLFSVNWKTGKKQFIPVNIPRISPKKVSLWNFQTMKESNEIFLYVRAQIEKNKHDIYIIRLNDKGEKEDLFNLTKDIDKNIMSVTASKLADGKYVFTGTYSKKFAVSSEGMYFCQGQEGKIDFIEFYNFLDLENFLAYLPQKRKKKLEKKKERKEKKGKAFKISYRIAAHNIIQLDDGYLFLGEAFYPTYRTETYYVTTTIGGVASRVPQYRTVFDGYQYTHAVLGKFDKQGKLIWDEIFELWSAAKPFYIKRFISIAEQKQNSIKLAFSSRANIFTKSVDFDGKVLEDSKSEEIQMAYDGDKSKWSSSNLSFWYENYFLAWGRQKIKNKEDNKKVKRKRKVYFVSKIKYE
ncbi:MAG: hypothetical protein ACPGJS_09135 [Flammeovirgaceae bacterium]